jgi:hypothetical protein
MEDETQRLLADALQNPSKYGITGCALCKIADISVTAIFSPTKAFSKRIGAPEGKLRLLVYGLCKPCSLLPGKADLVEGQILKLMAVQ